MALLLSQMWTQSFLEISQKPTLFTVKIYLNFLWHPCDQGLSYLITCSPSLCTLRAHWLLRWNSRSQEKCVWILQGHWSELSWELSIYTLGVSYAIIHMLYIPFSFQPFSVKCNRCSSCQESSSMEILELEKKSGKFWSLKLVKIKRQTTKNGSYSICYAYEPLLGDAP